MSYLDPTPQPQFLKDAISRIVDVNSFDPETGETPLIQAIRTGDHSALDILLDRPGIDINLESQGKEGQKGDAPITVAIWDDRARRTLLACPDLDINGTDREGNTGLILSVWYGYRQAVGDFAGQNAVDANVENIFGERAITLAAWKRDKDILRRVLGIPGLDLCTARAITQWTRWEEGEGILAKHRGPHSETSIAAEHGPRIIRAAWRRDLLGLLEEAKKLGTLDIIEDGFSALSVCAWTEWYEGLGALSVMPGVNPNVQLAGEPLVVLAAKAKAAAVFTELTRMPNLDLGAPDQQGRIAETIARLNGFTPITYTGARMRAQRAGVTVDDLKRLPRAPAPDTVTHG